jgi:hypothetical protein
MGTENRSPQAADFIAATSLRISENSHMFPVSYRDLELMLANHGVAVDVNGGRGIRPPQA